MITCLQYWRLGFHPWLARSPGEGNGYPLQYSCLENSMDRGVWQTTVFVVQLLNQVRLFVTPWTVWHIRLLCPSPSPWVCSNSCPLSWWCQPSHDLSSPSPPALNFSQHEGLFQLVGASHQVAKVLKLQLQYQSFQWIFPSGLTGLISLLSKWLSRAFSSTTVQKYQFSGAQPSLWSNSHIHTWLQEDPQLWLYRPLSAKRCLCFVIHCLGFS